MSDVEPKNDPPHEPSARTCVGCGARVPRAERAEAGLVRVVLGPDGMLAVDAGDSGFGRGAHVHATAACVEKAARAGLPRVLRRGELTILDDDGRTPLGPASLAKAIALAMERRLVGFFTMARRTRELAVGADSARDALTKGRGALVVVAKDAAPAELGSVRWAVAEGHVVAWGSKESLARVTGHLGELEMVVFLSERFARQVRAAVFVLDAMSAVNEGPARRKGARHRGASKAPDPGSPSPLPAGGRGSLWERGA